MSMDHVRLRPFLLIVSAFTLLACQPASEPVTNPTPTLTIADEAHSEPAIQPSFDIAALETELQALMSHYGVPGLSIAIIEDGQPVYESGFGLRNLEPSLPVTPDTRFRAGSVTKQFAAALLGVAVDAGRVDLSDHPSAYLPGLELAGEDEFGPMQVHHLLTHSAGFGNMDGTIVFFPIRDRADLYGRLPHLPISSPPGESFGYSNMGYTLAGLIAAPDGFDAALEAELLQPLDMTRSTMRFDAMMAPGDVAQGYAMVDGQAVAVAYEDMKLAGPSGALNTTASDLAHWVAFLINGGQHEGDRLLSSEFIDAATHMQWTSPLDGNEPTQGYGHGFFVEPFLDTRRVHHGGNTSGFTAHVDFLPERGLGMAILTNQQNSDIGFQVANLVYAQLLGQSGPDIESIEPRITDGRTEVEPTGLRVDDPPQLPLPSYSGHYRDPAYGTIIIRDEPDRLTLEFPDFTLPFHHAGGNRFTLSWVEGVHQNIPTFEGEFQVEDGQVIALSLPLRTGDERFMRLSELSE